MGSGSDGGQFGLHRDPGGGGGGPLDRVQDELDLQGVGERRGRVFARGLARTLDALNALGRRVVIVAQAPENEFELPIAMARAMKLAVEAGRLGYRAGRMAKRRYADPSSPLAGLI